MRSLLPRTVTVVTARTDLPGALLTGAEVDVVANAVETRRAEFATARDCARRALTQLGQASAEIPTGPRGEPVWPPGIVGSITHCDGLRACAVARSSEVLTIGIDAERNLPLPRQLLPDVASPREQTQIARLRALDPSINWDRLLFSAKEAVYKAWYPLTHRWLGFEDAALRIDVASESFDATILVDAPTIGGRALGTFSGRWSVENDLVMTAIAVPAMR